MPASKGRTETALDFIAMFYPRVSVGFALTCLRRNGCDAWLGFDANQVELSSLAQRIPELALKLRRKTVVIEPLILRSNIFNL